MHTATRVTRSVYFPIIKWWSAVSLAYTLCYYTAASTEYLSHNFPRLLLMDDITLAMIVWDGHTHTTWTQS